MGYQSKNNHCCIWVRSCVILTLKFFLFLKYIMIGRILIQDLKCLLKSVEGKPFLSKMVWKPFFIYCYNAIIWSSFFRVWFGRYKCCFWRMQYISTISSFDRSNNSGMQMFSLKKQWFLKTYISDYKETSQLKWRYKRLLFHWPDSWTSS